MIGDIFSMVLALAGTILVIVLTYYASRWYARKMGPLNAGKHIKVVDRLQVSKSGTVVIIEVNGKQYMVGASEQNVHLMTELDELLLIQSNQIAENQGFAELVRSLAGKVKNNER